MIFAKKAADDEDAIERIEVSDGHPEPGNAGALASIAKIHLAQPKVDMVAPERTHQMRRQCELFECRMRRHQRPDRAGAMLRHHLRQTLRDILERGLPIDGLPFA